MKKSGHNFLKQMFNFFLPTLKPADIRGRWIGFYKYHIGVDSMHHELKVMFAADFLVDGSFITGSIKEDESTGGIPERATIQGEIKSRKIVFRKMYPTRYWIDKDCNIIKDEKTPPQIVFYKGSYDRKKSKLYGIWEIHEEYIMEDNTRKIFYTSGSWEMEKENETY